MLTTFATEHGLLVIRAEDLRRIEDVRQGAYENGEMAYKTVCVVQWALNETELMHCSVLGTAQENLDRILAAEVKLLAAYEAMQQRQAQGLPALPIVRGGKVKP